VTPAKYGPFWRSDLPATVQLIKQSGKIRGQPPRNYFSSPFPKVKAKDGTLPPGTDGVEFWTDTPPDPHGIPGKPTWSAPGNTGANAGWYEIDVVITKTQP
jgi:hypothetical protein